MSVNQIHDIIGNHSKTHMEIDTVLLWMRTYDSLTGVMANFVLIHILSVNTKILACDKITW
jgi:hypothetical protein